MPREEKEVHIHIHKDGVNSAILQQLVEKIDDLVQTIDELGEQMATDLSRITSEVEETRSVIDGAVALITSLAQLLRDAANAPDVTAEVNALADSLDAKQAELAAAIEANTPAAPEPPA